MQRNRVGLSLLSKTTKCYRVLELWGFVVHAGVVYAVFLETSCRFMHFPPSMVIGERLCVNLASARIVEGVLQILPVSVRGTPLDYVSGSPTADSFLSFQIIDIGQSRYETDWVNGALPTTPGPAWKSCVLPSRFSVRSNEHPPFCALEGLPQ